MADMLKVCKQLPGNSEDDGSRPLNKRVAENGGIRRFSGEIPFIVGQVTGSYRDWAGT
jgi:hypothetical protein